MSAQLIPTLSQRMETNQTVEKSALIVGGTVLIPAGIAYLDKNQLVGFGLVVLGVVCLVVRELLKLK